MKVGQSNVPVCYILNWSIVIQQSEASFYGWQPLKDYFNMLKTFWIVFPQIETGI